MIKRRLSQVLALGTAVALTLSGCMSANAATENDSTEVTATPVETLLLEKDTIRSELTYIGQVQPNKTVNIASLLAAEVTSVNFELGDRVEEGDVLFTVDAEDIENQVKQLQAALEAQNIGVESAQYALELAVEGSAQQRLTELQYQSGVDQAGFASRNANESRYQASKARDAAENALERAEEMESAARAALQTFIDSYDRDMYIKNDANPSVYDPELAMKYQELKSAVATAQSAVLQAENALTQAENAYKLAGIGRGQADTAYDTALETYETYQELAEESKERAAKQAEFGLRSAQAQLASTQLQLSIAKNNLNRAIITSPISGVVSARNVEVGQMVSQASVPFTIIQMDPVVVQVGISETLINKVFPGDTVSVTIQALEDNSTLTGTVKAVSPSAGMTGTYTVKVELPNPDHLIKPGMFAHVTFVEAEKSNTFVVDKNVVLSDENNQFVYVVRDGKAVKTIVETGLSNGKQIEILSGVTEQDEVIVVGQEYLYNEMPVNVVARNGQRVNG